ncbi:MAG TPA: hypothetical protein DCQ26_18870 [Marinilabiliales bacterium]|nr:MAG: hypothetical protein A2W84_11125 [Bacteroidetes bacterium GWC2_40_13]OFX73460.1 MAG: hypothetical protein A2W96_10930 [Bacteroidetes bacterium GWD2_40_43]OFX90640.1 MAG: hypothetical protein A2W97_02600 [Bacteroidetes bacterium GWE2_40_63]OFY20883.1 MAG: hypothetical protein A2W88_17665 [Bacteroidetes bacterium GWF2_40_13]OFZ23698.1 MAG: hypothetical protein A2437_06575 [Bacteroidetes bacterium RIFOXYC2_FULL_40_12]HAN00662.1 hypothetical protein [Marinilabiliales bacterium]
MNTNTQIIIDKYIVQVFAILFNLAVKPLGMFLRINHSLDRNFTTIAVCKYKGMGSIIQATPLLKTLKANYPGSKIIFVTTPGNVEILKKTGLVDVIVTLNDSSVFKLIKGLPGFIIKLIRYKIEVYIDLEVYSNFSTLITILSMSKNRLGFYLQSKHYRLGNYTHMMYHNTRSPIMETYLQFARLLGCKIADTELIPLVSEITSINFDNLKLELLKKKYLVINPNASDLRLERRWGLENYKELIQLLVKHFPENTILVIGGKSESQYVSEVLKGLTHKNIFDISGKTNLDELIAIIKHAQLLITNDSGPMHIGFACKTPTIALFGPCSPMQYGNHKNSIAIYKNAYCSPCVHDFVNPPCKGNNQCMKLITVEDVLNSVQIFFQGTQFLVEKPSEIAYRSNGFILGTLNRKKRK